MFRRISSIFSFVKEKIIHFFKWLFSVKTLINHKLAVCIALVIIYFFVILIVPKFLFPENADLEHFYYMSQIISSLIVLLSATLALIQYIDSSNEKREDRLNQQKLKAAELAKSFASEAIPKSRDIFNIYKSDSEIYHKILDTLSSVELKDFNKSEVERIFPDYINMKTHLAICYFIQNNPDKDPSNISQSDVYTSLSEIDQKCHELANLFEYYAICFNAKIVHNDTLYQSLHKSFINAVHMVYIFIFCYNTSECDRLFFNTSKLYMDWQQIYKEKEKKEKDTNDEIEKLTRDKLKNIIIEP